MPSRITMICALILSMTATFWACQEAKKVQSPRQPHVGKWSGKDPSGVNATILFKEDGTGKISFDNKMFDFRYVFDYSKKPVWLDLIYTREGKAFRAKLIVKFLDGNRLKWRTFFNAERPEEFKPDDHKNTIQLERDNPIHET